MPAPGQSLIVDVVTIDSWRGERAASAVVVLVEPLYGSVALAAALDAGWAAAELAAEEPEVPPIPLVSFEVPPPAEHRTSGRCRVRASDLHALAAVVDTAGSALVGCVANARPLASRVSAMAADTDRITFVLAPAGDTHLPIDAMWASGVLVRILLEELDTASTLTDAAGIAVTLAQGAEDPAVQLTAGVRWARHLARGGHADDLRIAGAVDSIGAVPRLAREGDALVARPVA